MGIMITTAIGLILVFLMLSLLVTSIQEVLAGWFSMRGKMLEHALEKMLTNKSLEGKEIEVEKILFHRFQGHNWYKDLKPKRTWDKVIQTRAPDYLSPSAFAIILLHVLDGNDSEKLAKNINALPKGNLKAFLTDTLKDVNHDIAAFRLKLEHWYEETMDRVSGWYKHKVHQIILLVALLIAVIFNADTLSMYKKLSTNPDARIATLSEAQKLLGQNFITPDSALLVTSNVEGLTKVQDQIGLLLNEDIAAIQSPLGLGWHKVDEKQLKEEGFVGWAKKILGLLVTALAISLGAPFWFDLLKQFMHIRNAGKKSSTKQTV